MKSGRVADIPSPFEAERYKSHLQELLSILGLDVHYHRAAGEWMYYQDDAHGEMQVLDLVGGYGSLLFGHGHPDLTAEAIRFFSSQACNRAQGSVNRLAGELAAKLSRRLEWDCCLVLANSGAEAVEVALKHALLETGGRTFLTLERGFHGKTLATQQLTPRSWRARAPALGELDVVTLRPGDVAQLESALASVVRPAGFIFEPVQGEGGVHPVSAEYLQRAAQLCAARDIPFIADECQTGLGRTGSFLASRQLGLRPDYVVLAKGLGGGLAKIAAVLIDRARYEPEFDLLHGSTFADDGFSLAIALKTLSLLDEAFLANCRVKGRWLRWRLQQLKRRYPTVIADVRGAGLMLGIELCRPTSPDDFLLRFLGASELLGPVVAGHLLRVHRVRIASTLSDPLTLRIQPSALADVDSLRHGVAALEATCEVLQRRDVAGLTQFLARGGASPARFPAIWPSSCRSLEFRPSAPIVEGARPAPPRVAWLFHLADADDLPNLEPGLASLARDARENLLDRLAPLARPVVMDRVDIRSPLGQRVQLCPILLPVTSRWLKERFERRQMAELRALVQQGVDVAASLRCRSVSLGQFTSIVTRGGRSLASRGLGIASGNSFTAAIVVDAIRRTQRRLDLRPAAATLAVVGATGDIGQVCAETLGPEYRATLLVGSGRARSRDRLIRLARDLGVEWSDELSAVAGSDVVVCATNAVDAPLVAEHLAPGAIVCDASVPAMLAAQSLHQRRDVTLVPGGVVRLPGGEDLGIPGFPLPRGCVYGCLAESLLLGFEDRHDDTFAGRSSTHKARLMAAIGRRHGFLPADDATTTPWLTEEGMPDHVAVDSRS